MSTAVEQPFKTPQSIPHNVVSQFKASILYEIFV
jgi:hypothetical protein